MKYSSPGPALLAAGLLFCTLFAPFGAYADSKKDELSAKQNQAQQAYNEAQQELEELQNQQSETQSQIDQLQGQSAEVAAQLSGIYTALQEAQRTLDERTAAAEQAAQALADKQAEYDASLGRCKSQIGAMQLLDGGGSITLLMQARSLYEMLTFAETLRELADHNSAALAQLNAEAEALDTARAEAQAAADEAEAARAALDAQQTALEATQNELGSALQAANTALTEQQAAEQAQAVVTERPQSLSAGHGGSGRLRPRPKQHVHHRRPAPDQPCLPLPAGQLRAHHHPVWRGRPLGHPPPGHRLCRAGRHAGLRHC